MRRAFDIDVLACPRCGGRLRLIATLEDPDAIRAILAALAASRERADRAPPRRVARYQPHRCDQRLSAIRAPRTPRSVRSGPEPSCIPVNQLLTPPEIPLTGPLSALYLGERWAARATR